MNIIFKKYHALGNDYLIYDCNKNVAEGVRIMNPDGSEAEKSDRKRKPYWNHYFTGRVFLENKIE